MPFQSLLIANRGEIALRTARTTAFGTTEEDGRYVVMAGSVLLDLNYYCDLNLEIVDVSTRSCV